MPATQSLRAIDILINTAEKLGEMIDVYLSQKELDRQRPFLNLTTMVMYLLVTTVRAIDTAMKNDSMGAGGRKGRKSGADSTPHQLWEERRYQVQSTVFHLMERPLEKLWNMPIAEESFVT